MPLNADTITLLSGVGANSGLGSHQLIELGYWADGVLVHVQQIDSGRVRFEGTIDGRNWFVKRGTNVATGSAATSTTTSGAFFFDSEGLAGIRTPNDGWSTGIVTVAARVIHKA